MNSQLRIALLGGSGFVGSELARARTGNWDVIRLDVTKSAVPVVGVADRVVDVLDERALNDALKEIDLVVHLANVPVRTPPPYASELLRDAFAVNVGSVYAAIRACERNGVASFIHVSSLSVFTGALPDDPVGNGDALDPYGFTKRLAENVCATLADLGPTVTSVRIAFPTPDADWPEWRRPSDRTSVPLELDGHTYTALRISDLARAIDLLSRRRGNHLTVALAGDHRLAPTIDDLQARALEFDK